MALEDLQEIQYLERFAQKLDPEQRAEIYRIASGLYTLGVRHGFDVKEGKDVEIFELENYLLRRVNEIISGNTA